MKLVGFPYQRERALLKVSTRRRLAFACSSRIQARVALPNARRITNKRVESGSRRQLSHYRDPTV